MKKSTHLILSPKMTSLFTSPLLSFFFLSSLPSICCPWFVSFTVKINNKSCYRIAVNVMSPWSGWIMWDDFCVFFFFFFFFPHPLNMIDFFHTRLMFLLCSHVLVWPDCFSSSFSILKPFDTRRRVWLHKDTLTGLQLMPKKSKS